MGDTTSGVTFWAHNLMDTDLGENLGVCIGVRFRPDTGYTQIHQVRGGEYRRFQIRADAENNPLDFVDTELHQRLTISSVTDGCVGEKTGAFLNKASISVHAEYFHTVAGQLFGKRGAETSQAQNNNGGNVDAAADAARCVSQ